MAEFADALYFEDGLFFYIIFEILGVVLNGEHRWNWQGGLVDLALQVLLGALTGRGGTQGAREVF